MQLAYKNKMIIYDNLRYVEVLCRGVLIIGTAKFSLRILVIGTDSQRNQHKCRYSISNINFYLTHAKERIATKYRYNHYLHLHISFLWIRSSQEFM